MKLGRAPTTKSIFVKVNPLFYLFALPAQDDFPDGSFISISELNLIDNIGAKISRNRSSL